MIQSYLLVGFVKRCIVNGSVLEVHIFPLFLIQSYVLIVKMCIVIGSVLEAL